MKGWIIVNNFLRIEKFLRMYNYLKESFSKENIQLEVKFSGDISEKLWGKGIEDSPSFVLFWDKDIYLAKQLENKGVKVFNSSKSIELCDNKMLMYLELMNKGVKIPKTVLAPKTFEGVNYNNLNFLDEAIKELGFPMVVKEAYGSFGKQVYLVENRTELETLIKELNHKEFLMQEYINSSYGIDIRVNVVGDEEIVSMIRENSNDFRSNISNGGKGEKVILTKEQKDLALKAIKALGCDFGGVDLLYGKQGEPIVCEVNSNPNFESTLLCTGVDLSQHIAKYIKTKIKDLSNG